MALEKFIRGKVDSAHHAGLRSTRRRLEESMDRLKEWQNERIAAHEQGHSEPELCFPGEIGGHFQIDQYPEGQDTEIVLFQAPKPAIID